MTPKQQVHIKWNWQLSSSPEQLWMYVADTNRLFKNLNLPSIRPTGFSRNTQKGNLQLSYNSIKYPDVWTEEPFEWEYPFRYGVKRTYKSGPFKEIKIRVDLFPNRKGTRLQYQLWAEPKHFFTAVLSTLKHKTIQRARLKSAFRYYDELVKRNCLPYEARFKKSLFQGASERFRNIRKNLTAGMNNKLIRLIAFFKRSVPQAYLKKVYTSFNAFTERVRRLYRDSLKKKIIHPAVKRLGDIRKNVIVTIDLKNRTSRLTGFTRRLIQQLHLKEFFSYCVGHVRKNYLVLQAHFKKKLYDIADRIRNILIAANSTLTDSANRLINSIQAAISRTRLQRVVISYDKLNKKYRRWQTQLRKRLADIQKTLAIALKNIAGQLIDFVHRLLQHPYLNKTFAYCSGLAEKNHLAFQARFNRKSIHRNIKKLNDLRSRFVSGLKDIGGQILVFIRQTMLRLKQDAIRCGEFIEKYRRLYKARFKRSLARNRNRKLHSLREVLIDATGLKDIVDRLIEFIRRADDIDLIRINPYQLADYWQFERKDVLFVFLHAAKEGLLNFNWDLYCPVCRTIQQTCETLNEVHEPVLCSDCSHDFTINFNQSIQLSFRPSPLIRKINNGEYCPANPRSKPHIVIQQHLKAGQKRHLKTRLENGIYYLRIANSKGKAIVLVDENGQETVNIRVSGYGLRGEQTSICREPNLIFQNSTQTNRTFILEKASWQNRGVTAAQVTSLQVFRDLFAEEVLQKGEKIAVDRLTLMFTDLFDSTGMYQKEGDNQAVGRVIEHFEILQHAVAKEDGALVKTIGDSIMAVFSDPDQAFRAFITAQKMISEDAKFGKSLKLKAGIHHGNCVAVNLNNRIDYFGSTVNIASRLADLANENEVVFLEDIAKSKKVHRLITDNLLNCTVEQESANLKGFETETFNIERIRLEKSHLRLAI